MLSVCTQTTITVLYGISSNNVMQSVNIFLSEEGLSKLCSPLPDINLLDILEAATEKSNHHMMFVTEKFYIHHAKTANKKGVLNEVVRTFLADIKVTD